jgi:hypothetical protein
MFWLCGVGDSGNVNLAMWVWQSDKNHLENIAKKKEKIAKWTWQFGKMDLRNK